MPPGKSPTHVALLRAVNLPNHGKVTMSDLRPLLAKLGFDRVETLLQSGNLILRGGDRSGAALERLLETETKKGLGLETTYFVRTLAAWRSLIARNPFPAEAKSDPSHLVVMFLKDAVAAEPIAALQAAIGRMNGREVVRGQGNEVSITYPDGIGRSRVTNAVIEKHLGARATGRNWNTVLKLEALANLATKSNQPPG
jgi:uncharacterized protein (DUF1697 family)